MTISGGSVTSDSGISGCTMVTGSQDSTEHGFLWRSLEISADYGENTVTRVSLTVTAARYTIPVRQVSRYPAQSAP